MKLPLIVIPVLALGGFALTGLAVARFNMPPKTGPAPIAPPSILFPDRVAGVGIVEPASETILIGAHVGGVVTKVLVQEGSRVEAGAPLVELDARDADARIEIAKAAKVAAAAAVETARARAVIASLHVAELRAHPRPEDVAEATALVDARKSALADATGRLERLMKVSDRGSTANEQPTLEFAVAFATAQVAEADAKLMRARAGTYPEDLAVAQAEEVAAAREVDALTVQAGPNAGALLRLGDISTLHVRTDIDELDAWRFHPTGEAVATVRGGSREQVVLRFIRVIPDVAPKKTLTGENSERIDTRVVQVIYALENPPPFLQPGMLVDVAVAAKPFETTTK